jgi:hypothetical protein
VFASPEPLHAFKGWAVCARAAKQHDEALVDGWKDEIDSLLVFVRYLRLFISHAGLKCSQAGLFSAVLTAFAVESYQMLSTDPAETSAVLLRQIAVQLNDLVTHAATPSPLRIPPLDTRTPNSVVRINSKHIR